MNFSSYLDLQKHNGKLVKLTYMIQNIEDPEIYANFLVQTQNPSQIINLKYREHFSGDVSSYNLETDSVLSERLPLYCIPITGDNTSNSISTTSIIEIENLSENQNIILKYQNIDIKPQDHILSFYEKLKLKGVFNSNSSKGFPCIVKVINKNEN